MQEIRAGNEGTYIRGQSFVRYAGQMIGSLVLCTAKTLLEQRQTLKVLTCKWVYHPGKVSIALDRPTKLLSYARA